MPVVKPEEELYNKVKLKPTIAAEPNIGIDTNNTFIYELADSIQTSTADLSKISSFISISQQRDQLYSQLDAMAQDPRIESALEIYAEDTTERSELNQIVWVESSDSSISNYIQYLLDSFRINKNIYKWAYSLCKYGDLYVRLFRKSDMKDDIFYNQYDENERQLLNEDMKLYAYKDSDKYVEYVEMIPNPAEMFELTRFGKTQGYIKAPVLSPNNNGDVNDIFNSTAYTYKFRKEDISIYQATEFVHACIDAGMNRYPEEVQISTNEEDETTSSYTSYSVRRGKSLLQDLFSVWRILQLLENSIMLNRVTKSSIVRLINVNVGDMPKDRVNPYLAQIKSMIEQKSAINTSISMREYNNPGPIENNVYVPVRGEIGAISASQIGGEGSDPKSLADLDYFRDLLFAGIGIPKQYLGCLRGNTEILLLNGHKTTVEDMFNNKDEYIGKGIMACNADGSLQPTVITNIMLTKPSTDFIRVHLDNGEYVDVTNDHRMILRDGSCILAEDLEIGDSLMPYYDYIKDGRRYVLDNNQGKYRPQYRVVAESVCDIPKGYQVHHLNSIKIDDDFNNLKPMTVAEHYQEHVDALHEAAKKANDKRRAEGKPVNKNVGNIIINNGIKEFWFNPIDDIPVGYVKGRLPFTEEHRRKIGDAHRGIPKNYDCSKHFGPDCAEKSKTVKAERRAKGLYAEQFKKHSEDMKLLAKEHRGWHSPEAYAKKMSLIPENRKNKNHYVRCLCCGAIREISCNQDWYDKYLNEDVFWYCSKDCAKINGKGKLSRSYKLFLLANSDPELYEDMRWNGEHRPDSYFKYETLAERLKYINNYTPECNHKVVDIEYINVNEPAYDISVAADCHTFALPCGIFVHNCTDDSTGFNGGTSLTLISSRYAKKIRAIQSSLIEMVTDIVNLILLNRGMESYINKFEIKMQPPTTQEEKDRKENVSQGIQITRDILDMLQDIQDPATKLEITKILLSANLVNPDLIAILEKEVEKLREGEGTEEEESLDDFGDSEDLGSLGSGGSSSFNEPAGGFEDFETETAGEDISGETETEESNVLPNMSDLNMDFTDNTEEF